MWILGISSSHNAAVGLIEDGRIRVAVQAERLSRRKREALLIARPTAALRDCIRYCLEFCGIDYGDLDAVACSTPWDHCDLDLGVIFGNRDVRDLSRIRAITVPHHLAHAEYILHYSPTADALVLVIDGSGSFESQRPRLTIKELEDDPMKFVEPDGKETISAYRYDGSALRLVYRSASWGQHLARKAEGYLQSFGHLWEWASNYIFLDGSEAGKVMGLAGFGDPRVYRDLELLSFRDGGQISVRFDRLDERFGKRNTARLDALSDPHYAHLAAHIQECTNRALLELCRFLHRRIGARDLCYCGGVALNGIANEHLIEHGPFERVFLNGSCEDNGTAVGAALAAYHHLTGRRVVEPVTDFYGRAYSESEAVACIERYGVPFQRLSREAMIAAAADAITSGQVIGWFQGRSEFGPRALGNRSILADARSDTIKPTLDHKVKKREPYRPYAPAVIEEAAEAYFRMRGPSPVMIRVGSAKDGRLPAVTHVDRTVRVQTVSRNDNPVFYDLLRAVGERTGIPVVLNTSFNVAGEPIVESPADAMRTFLYSGMEKLVLGNCVVRRPESGEP